MNEPLGVLTAYSDAAATTADVVARISGDLWSDPGLGEWDLRALVGHTSLALVNVLTYLDRPARTEDITSPEAYYTLRSAQTGEGADATAVVQRGRQAGDALGVELGHGPGLLAALTGRGTLPPSFSAV